MVCRKYFHDLQALTRNPIILQPDEKPDVSYSDIGGMDMQKQEMKEAVELPLTHFDLYKQVTLKEAYATRTILEKK